MAPPIIPVHPSSHPADASPTVVMAPMLQDIASTATLSHSVEDLDIVAPSAEQGTLQISFIAPTHKLAPPPFVPPSPPLIQLSVPRFHAYVLVDSEIDGLKGQCGSEVPDASGVATPLVDVTVRFFQEFEVEEEPPSTQRQSQLATTSRAKEKKKHDNAGDSFEPMYLYGAVKEKRKLKPLLDGQQRDAKEFLSLYLDALDKELPCSRDDTKYRRENEKPNGTGTVPRSLSVDILRCEVSGPEEFLSVA